MGQYHVLVNLSKRQYVHPHQLGCGLKLVEQTGAGEGGVGAALLVLLAVSNNRGGGDFHSDNEIIGSWGGDRIAVVGDYAEDTDLPRLDDDPPATHIYALCQDDDPDPDPEWLAEMGYTEADRFRNITPDIRQVFEEVEGCVYAGSGWMFRVDIWDLKEAGLESTYANPDGPGRVCQFADSIILPYAVVTAEVRRIVAADSRGGYGVEWSRDFHAAGLAK